MVEDGKLIMRKIDDGASSGSDFMTREIVKGEMVMVRDPLHRDVCALELIRLVLRQHFEKISVVSVTDLVLESHFER